VRVTNSPAPPFISGLSDLASSYRALLCDVWGVVHDGARAHLAATDALREFRRRGGAVLLITNAPRPKAGVVALFERLAVPDDCYDDILTSGSVARELLKQRPGVRVHHVGPERDLPLYEGLSLSFVGEDSCDLISCTGLFDDERETPDDYRERLVRWHARRLPMLCVNPDIVVERGDRLVWCAGALAERYREIGGETTIVGKPYASIYQLALARLAALLHGTISVGEVLVVGDGIDTDIRGAVGQNLDALFVTGGIHAAVFGDRERPDIAKVHALLETTGLGARALVTRLVW
jgi:HAD superfamily hydrolase (TIGR01459 family)